jgi:hypothetical protein
MSMQHEWWVEKCTQNFSLETCTEETTISWVLMGDNIKVCLKNVVSDCGFNLSGSGSGPMADSPELPSDFE